MYELQAVTMKIGDISRLVGRCEVCSVGRLALVNPTGADRGRVGRVNCLLALAHDARVPETYVASPRPYRSGNLSGPEAAS